MFRQRKSRKKRKCRKRKKNQLLLNDKMTEFLAGRKLFPERGNSVILSYGFSEKGCLGI
jgi:hypothetical protein